MLKFYHHRDVTKVFFAYVNPLVLKTFKIYQNLELNVVKFKIRGGLLGIMLKSEYAEVRAEEYAEDMILPKTYCVSAEGLLPAEVVDSAEVSVLFS